MPDLIHLHALNLRLSRERERFSSANTYEEREMRSVWVTSIEKEIGQERIFLGLPEVQPPVEVSDDDLLCQLGL